jgi:hypothetical protein
MISMTGSKVVSLKVIVFYPKGLDCSHLSRSSQPTISFDGMNGSQANGPPLVHSTFSSSRLLIGTPVAKIPAPARPNYSAIGIAKLACATVATDHLAAVDLFSAIKSKLRAGRVLYLGTLLGAYSLVRLARCPLCPDSDQVLRRSEMSRWTIGDLTDNFTALFNVLT